MVLSRPTWRRTDPIDVTGGCHPAVQGLQVRGGRSGRYVCERALTTTTAANTQADEVMAGSRATWELWQGLLRCLVGCASMIEVIDWWKEE
jgi:hypothetical protein